MTISGKHLENTAGPQESTLYPPAVVVTDTRGLLGALLTTRIPHQSGHQHEWAEGWPHPRGKENRAALERSEAGG